MGKHVIGINGCRGGWLICRIDVATVAVDLIAAVRHLSEVLEREDSAIKIAIDIPIGLPEIGCARRCDLQARKLLTSLRGSSVFPAPPRELITKLDYSETNRYAMSICGKGVSKQAHAIFPRIAEVDGIMTPDLQERLFEVHPELCFWGLAGRPMQYGKKKSDGYEERREVLSRVLANDVPARSEVRRLELPIEPDDVLDALAAGYSAYRAYTGDARRIPDLPEVDRKGLRMEMVY